MRLFKKFAPVRMTNLRLADLISEIDGAPIALQSQLDSEELTFLLEANYDRALDAKFALSGGVLWSVFMHPLGELTDQQFKDCVQQVAKLADNFGTSYASSDLYFTGY